MIRRADACPWTFAKSDRSGPPAGRLPAPGAIERVLAIAGAPERATPLAKVDVALVEDLRPSPWGDPGAIDDGLVARYQANYAVDPPLVDSRGRILDGHLRVASAAAAGHREIFVVRLENGLVKSPGALAKNGLVNGLAKGPGDQAPDFDLSDEEIMAALGEDLGSEAADLLQESLLAGGNLQSGALGFDFDNPDPGLIRRVRTRATHLEEVLDENTAHVVRDQLRRGLEAGETEAELIDRLVGLGEFGAARARRIARTEVHGQVMGGSLEAMRQRGINAKQWLSAPDEKTRPAHREALGQQVPLDEPFEVDGEELMYPGDPEGSPGNVIQCRCTMLGIRAFMDVDEFADGIDLEDPDGEALDEDLEEMIREAIREEMKSGEVSQIDLDNVDSLIARWDSEPGTAEYNADLEMLSVGDEADPKDVADAVREHLVRSVMSQADVDGFYNEVELADLPVPHGGTRTQVAVDAVVAGIQGDRETVEEMVGRNLDDDEWDIFESIARQFWTSPGTNQPSPTQRTRKAEQIAGDLCRGDSGHFESCSGGGLPEIESSVGRAEGSIASVLKESENYGPDAVEDVHAAVEAVRSLIPQVKRVKEQRNKWSVREMSHALMLVEHNASRVAERLKQTAYNAKAGICGWKPCDDPLVYALAVAADEFDDIVAGLGAERKQVLRLGKAEQVAGNLCRGDGGKFESCGEVSPNRSGVPEIDNVIEAFEKEKLGDWTNGGGTVADLRDPACSHGVCQEVAEQFVAFAKERGLNAYVTQTDLKEMGYKPKGKPHGEVMNRRGKIVPGFYPEHTVASIYLPNRKIPIIVDFAASQYGYKEFPKITKSDGGEVKKAENISGDLCRGDDGKFESCSGGGISTEMADKFDALAQEQRGAPEEAMHDIAHAQIAQEYASLAEHVGDLTHRMAQRPDFFEGGREWVGEKLDKTLRWLGDAAFFKYRMVGQIERNQAYYEKKGESKGTASEMFRKVEELGAKYADEHAKLRVYNEAQKLARDAAVDIGRMKFKDAKDKLTKLKAVSDQGDKAWTAYALRVDWPEGKL